MPTYTFNCATCGIKDITRSINDDTLTSCPDCGNIDFKKIFGNIGISFKGKGFYSTDSRSKGDK